VTVSSISQQLAEIQSPLPQYFGVPNSDDSQVGIETGQLHEAHFLLLDADAAST
jgi:hypothetical protein